MTDNALFAQSLNWVQYLVEEGVDINRRNNSNQRTINLSRTKYRNKEIYEYLMNKKKKKKKKKKQKKKKKKKKFMKI